jgi:geranylgeranyl diphosphate synthase type II
VTGSVEAVRTGSVVEPEFLKRERLRVEAALGAIAAGATRKIGAELRPPVAYALSSTGKRLRPVLCVTAYRAATRPAPVPDALYRLSCTLEIVHTYSLIHDDLPCMDDDDLRRGRPTVHRVYGITAAVLAGAALLPLAVEVLEGSAQELGKTPRERGVLVSELMRAAGAEGMVGGQLLDLQAEGRSIEGPELESIHTLKTGALLTAALRIGAIAGGAASDLLDAVTAYGRALGLAFQIADDLLDVEGSAENLGKAPGRDSQLNKASYPALYGVAGARARAREKVDEAKRAIEGYELTDLAALADYVVERPN